MPGSTYQTLIIYKTNKRDIAPERVIIKEEFIY